MGDEELSSGVRLRGAERASLQRYQRQIFSFLVLAVLGVVPVAIFQLWADWRQNGHWAILLLAGLYFFLYLTGVFGAWWVLRRSSESVDLPALVFCVAALTLISGQYFFTPDFLRWVAGLEFSFIGCLLFLLLSTRAFRQAIVGVACVGILLLLWPETAFPQPVDVPGWNRFNVLIAPAAIYAVTMAAAIIVNVRLQELAGRHLRIVRAMAGKEAELRQANRDLQLFVLAASHDLRQPLRQIRSFMQLLKQRHANELRDGDLAYVESVGAISGRMEGLLEDLLAYSKAGSDGLQRHWHDSRVLLQQGLMALEADWSAAGATLKHEGLPWVLVDGPLLTGVFQNLLENCLKYRDPARPLVVTVWAEPDLGRLWRLNIEDNGLGLSPNEVEGVFEIFRRAHPEANYPGHGIGLAYCRKVLDLHRGRIWMDSEKGRGSTVHLSLPGQLAPPGQA